MIKLWCDVCKKSCEVEIEKLTIDNNLNGDIICKECRFVLTTLSADKPGEYQIERKKCS
ncbi:MAG: hypothetical protein GY858_06910 [Candidatus Omnitrophica bacterium]|nr:hypothetical protein [Candidatus Omnitrophota bacterium]